MDETGGNDRGLSSRGRGPGRPPRRGRPPLGAKRCGPDEDTSAGAKRGRSSGNLAGQSTSNQMYDAQE